MEHKENIHKERIHYIVEKYESGKYEGTCSYTGKSVNYGLICSSWKSPEDLEDKMRKLMEVYLRFGQETLDKHGLEMKEVNEKEWDALEDNIPYWEFDRTRRLLQKPEVQEKWIQIMEQYIEPEEAKVIMQALIDQPNNY